MIDHMFHLIEIRIDDSVLEAIELSIRLGNVFVLAIQLERKVGTHYVSLLYIVSDVEEGIVVIEGLVVIQNDCVTFRRAVFGHCLLNIVHFCCLFLHQEYPLILKFWSLFEILCRHDKFPLGVGLVVEKGRCILHLLIIKSFHDDHTEFNLSQRQILHKNLSISRYKKHLMHKTVKNGFSIVLPQSEAGQFINNILLVETTDGLQCLWICQTFAVDQLLEPMLRKKDLVSQGRFVNLEGDSQVGCRLLHPQFTFTNGLIGLLLQNVVDKIAKAIAVVVDSVLFVPSQSLDIILLGYIMQIFHLLRHYNLSQEVIDLLEERTARHCSQYHRLVTILIFMYVEIGLLWFAAICLESLGVFVEHVLQPFEITTKHNGTRLNHNTSIFIQQSQFEKRVYCFIDYPYGHCMGDLCDGCVAEMVIGSQRIYISDLVFGFLCKISKVVKVEIIFHRLSISLVLSINPQYPWQPLFDQSSIVLRIQVSMLEFRQSGRYPTPNMIQYSNPKQNTDENGEVVEACKMVLKVVDLFLTRSLAIVLMQWVYLFCREVREVVAGNIAKHLCWQI